MKRMGLEELKKIQIQILDVFASFCEENNIRYWLDCGTLLGAVRHHGYIPWDDDIDVGMLRPDYDRLCLLFNKTNSRYRLINIESDKSSYFSYSKVVDTNTLLYEPDENGFQFYINIDVFVYDNAPDDSSELKRMFDRRDHLNRQYQLQRGDHFPKGNAFRRFAIRCYQLWLRRKPGAYYIEQMVRNSKSYSEKTTQKVGNFTSASRMVCDRSAVLSTVMIKFEGKEYCCPSGYALWLKAFYGNTYMQLPPLEKRVSHHSFIAYINDSEEILK